MTEIIQTGSSIEFSGPGTPAYKYFGGPGAAATS